jgi:hypothetical protein
LTDELKAWKEEALASRKKLAGQIKALKTIRRLLREEPYDIQRVVEKHIKSIDMYLMKVKDGF